MHIYRNSASMQGAVEASADDELSLLITARINELQEYIEEDLSEVMNLVVIEPDDMLRDVASALGFNLLTQPLDVIEEHIGWYELTYVLRSDGFGMVVLIPKHPDVAPCLRALCVLASSEGTL
jgi:hypothetical protein